MKEILCQACLLPFKDGDECREVGNNLVIMMMGKKSGQMLLDVIKDPSTSVIVHAHCTVLYEDPRTNDEYADAVETAKRPEWEEEWKEENFERVRLEAVAAAPDYMKTVCAGCNEEIEFMGAPSKEARY